MQEFFRRMNAWRMWRQLTPGHDDQRRPEKPKRDAREPASGPVSQQYRAIRGYALNLIGHAYCTIKIFGNGNHASLAAAGSAIVKRVPRLSDWTSRLAYSDEASIRINRSPVPPPDRGSKPSGKPMPSSQISTIVRPAASRPHRIEISTGMPVGWACLIAFMMTSPTISDTG